MNISESATAKEMWEALEVAHEGMSRVKENRLNTLVGEYMLLRMKEGEIIKDMQIQYTHIVNQLIALEKTYTQQEQVRKILRALPFNWQSKVTAIEEARGESMRSVVALFRNLAEYEGKINALKEVTHKKKKGITLKVADDDDDDDEEEEDLDDEELGLLVK